MNNTIKHWRSNNSRLAFLVFLGIAGYFLWAEHRVHAIQYLPLLLILACVVMHFFMHSGGHGKGQHHNVNSDNKQDAKTKGGHKR